MTYKMIYYDTYNTLVDGINCQDGIDDIINSCYQEHVDAMNFYMREEDDDGEPIDLDDPFIEKCLLISMAEYMYWSDMKDLVL